MTTEYKNLIDGELIVTEAWMSVINPADETVIGKVPSCGEGELNSAVEAARRAFKTWSKSSIDERRACRVVVAALAALGRRPEAELRLVGTLVRCIRPAIRHRRIGLSALPRARHRLRRSWRSRRARHALRCVRWRRAGFRKAQDGLTSLALVELLVPLSAHVPRRPPA